MRFWNLRGPFASGLVGRYAHLSPTHLKAVVETVASFGKPFHISLETQRVKAEEAPISNVTVTRTVMGKTVT